MSTEQRQNGYKAFYGNRETEVWADTAYQATMKAIEYFKPAKSKKHLVHVVICESNGKQVVHSTASL